MLFSLAVTSFRATPAMPVNGVQPSACSTRAFQSRIHCIHRVPDEVAIAGGSSWDFRHGHGGKALSTSGAINGAAAMIEVRSTPAVKASKQPAAMAASKQATCTSHLQTGAGSLAKADQGGQMSTRDPDEAVYQGVSLPNWEFRHGHGGAALANAPAINGASANIVV